MKKISIITRSYPPNKGINGLLANELSGYLINNGIEVDIICIEGVSDGNKEEEKPNGNIHSIPPLNDKSTKFKKTLSLLFEGYKLIKKAKSLDSDLIIVTTSPPLLPFWSSLMLKKRKWALWAFDLFPEGLAISNLMNEKGVLYKILYKYTYKTPPNILLALGENQAKYIKEKYNKEIETLILPAGVLLNPDEVKKGTKPDWKDDSEITLGYFGNIGIAHNPSYLKAIIDFVENNDNYNFILSLYGVYSEEIKHYAKDKKSILIQEGGIAEEHLKHIDIHVVSLKSSWTHIAVPSKAVTAISCGRPILFCGKEESDNWQMFKESAWLIKENEDIQAQIQFLLNELSPKKIEEKAKKTPSIYEDLKKQVIETYESLIKI